VSIYYFDDGFSKVWPHSSASLVMTNGVFDILHRGHVQYLKDAALLNDRLVVGVNSDESVRTLGKGAERPYIKELDRAFILNELSSVSDVIIFDQTTPEELVACLQPAVFVKGADYSIETLPEAKIVFGYGGKVELIPLSEGYSTTSIVRSIQS